MPSPLCTGEEQLKRALVDLRNPIDVGIASQTLNSCQQSKGMRSKSET